MAASAGAAGTASGQDRLAVIAERLLRRLGDARLGLGLLLLTGIANLLAALLPEGPRRLEGLPYAILLGALALSAVAAVAVRVPATWREWRRPGPVTGGGALQATVAARPPDEVAAILRQAGYRTRSGRGRRHGTSTIHAVRRGWSRFAAHASHLGLAVIVLGAAIGAAFGSETTFSLLPGDQALLDAPRPGLSSAVRLDRLDATFGADGRPSRLDTEVTFLRDGEVVEARVLRVNEPGSFDGYLVHPWTYGPAARIRIATLGGAILLDAPIPLDGLADGRPAGAVELPSAGLSVGLVLADGATNALGVSVVAADGLVDTASLQPGDDARVGDLVVSFERFDAWVTLMSRRDPGVGILFAGAALLCLSLAVGFWLPRRRLTVRPVGTSLSVTLRGERFDHPRAELDRLVGLLGARR